MLLISRSGAAVLACSAAALALAQTPRSPQEGKPVDPPGRVARLSYEAGAVSFKPAGMEIWVPATHNYPVKADDQIWTEADGRAELTTDNVTVRLGRATSFSFLGLDDGVTHVMLQQGTVIVRVRWLRKNEWVEVDSPNSAVTLLKPGLYRVGFDGSAETTKVIVRGSEAEVLVAGSTFRVEAKQQARVTGDPEGNPTYDITEAAPADDFDHWSTERDKRMTSAPAEHVSRDVIGYEDLSENGTWKTVPEYGTVWQPTAVDVGWVPYRFGRWLWVEPWGWTWVDDAPWGFAPFHYGRWAFAGGGWVWVPGPIDVRHWYAPALVGFVGAGTWSVSFRGGGFAWFPLGPGEPFIPIYRVTPAYVQRVNVNMANANVTNVTHVNRGVTGAVTAVSRDTVTLSRPVGAVAVAVPAASVASAPVAGTAPLVAPRPESVLGRSADAAGSVAQPPAAIASRVVITRHAPAPPTVPFATRQAALAAHPGRPLDAATLASLRGDGATSNRPFVHSAAVSAKTALKPSHERLPAAKPYTAGSERTFSRTQRSVANPRKGAINNSRQGKAQSQVQHKANAKPKPPRKPKTPVSPHRTE
jgi:hypothetical protein